LLRLFEGRQKHQAVWVFGGCLLSVQIGRFVYFIDFKSNNFEKFHDVLKLVLDSEVLDQ